MKDTGFTLPADKADRMTHLYFKDHRKDLIRCIDRGRETTFLKPAEMLGGGGGLLSTLTDYYKFCHMLESNGTVQWFDTFIQTNTGYHAVQSIAR